MEPMEATARPHGYMLYFGATLINSTLFCQACLPLRECVWMMAGFSSLSCLSQIGLWGWLRLHTCCTLRNRCAQVEPANATHAQEENSCMATWSTGSYVIICRTYNEPDIQPHPVRPCLEEPNKGPLVGVWQPQRWCVAMDFITALLGQLSQVLDKNRCA